MSKTILRVNISRDSDTENPLDYSSWELISFNRRHQGYADPDTTLRSLAIRTKLRYGTAFLLGYFEHGGCQWALSGEHQQCPWDSVNVAGVLVWRGRPQDLGPTPDKRRESARATLVEYTDWCNGECYAYGLDLYEVADDWEGDDPQDDGEPVQSDGCGGFIGYEYTRQEVANLIKDMSYDAVHYTQDAKVFA